MWKSDISILDTKLHLCLTKFVSDDLFNENFPIPKNESFQINSLNAFDWKKLPRSIHQPEDHLKAWSLLQSLCETPRLATS